MDLIRIGRYIAEKRKALGMTQREVAEKLGMSDKSVSKWERGICLPDVSVYEALCGVLKITLNEFLAGEDIPEENLARKSEENLIVVATDSKHRQKRLKRVIFLLLAVSILAASWFGVTVLCADRAQSYIVPADRDSVEMKTIGLLAGLDGAFLYHFAAAEEFTSLEIYVSEYQAGKLVNKENFGLSYEGMTSPENGSILIVPDFDSFAVRLIVADESEKLSTSVPILDGVENRQYYGRTATQMNGKNKICYGEEQGLVALIYGENELRVPDLQGIMDGRTENLVANDYVYLFSVRFCKETS